MDHPHQTSRPDRPNHSRLLVRLCIFRYYDWNGTHSYACAWFEKREESAGHRVKDDEPLAVSTCVCELDSTPMHGWTVDALGYGGTLCGAVAMLPQLAVIVKTRSVRGLFLPSYLIFAVGGVFWTAYGICLGDVPVILANGVSLFVTGSISGMILASKIRERTRNVVAPEGCGEAA